MYNPNYIDWGPQGWRCPVCGRCYSPTTPMCFYCSNKEGTVQTTGTSINDIKWWEEYLKQSQTGTPVSSVTEMGQNLAELLHNAIGGLFND